MAAADIGQSDLIKRLAHNDKAVRDRAVATVSQWLASKPVVSDVDMLKLWKGMFYCTAAPDTFQCSVVSYSYQYMIAPPQVFGCRTKHQFNKNWRTI